MSERMLPTATVEPRPDASMTLLREVMERPLDPGYDDAARRRAAGGGSPVRPARRLAGRLLVLLLAAAIGLGGVWAARSLRNPLPELSARQVLIEQIRERTEIGDALAEGNAALREEIQDLQEQAFGDTAAAAVAEARQLGVWAGTSAVVGPGVVITMQDSDRAQRGEPGTEEERVTDFDLQVVVNALWASGAEAIAINGIRLTGATAIRSAGDAVLVDLRPLVTPYRIEAIGDPDGMRTRFAQTSAAGHLSFLSSRWQIGSEMVVDRDLSLPAGSSPRLAVLQPSEDG